MLQKLEFSKAQITFELRMNSNEKNTRILQRMKQVFKLGNFQTLYRNTNINVENCPKEQEKYTIKCYSQGRGKTLKFIVEINEKLLPYFNLKLWLIQNCNFRSDFDYELVLAHLHLIQNNNKLTTLEKIAEEIDTDEQTIKRHREKLNYKVFATKDLCKRTIYDSNKNIVPFELYESINRTFKKAWNSMLKQYPNQTYVELYVKRSNNYEGDWHIVSINNSDYDHIVDSLVSKGYEFDTNALLYIDNKSNEYLKDKAYQIHLQINGINYTYFHTIYKLTERIKSDKNFNELLNNAYQVYVMCINL